MATHMLRRRFKKGKASLYKRPVGRSSTLQFNSRSSAVKMAKCQLVFMLTVAITSLLVAEVVPSDSRSVASSQRYPKQGFEKRTGEVQSSYDQQNQHTYYPATADTATDQVEYSSHADTEDMETGSSHQYPEYQNQQPEDPYAATQAAIRPVKTKVRYHEEVDTEDSNAYLRIKKQYATGDRVRNKQRRRRPGASSYATQGSATEKHDSHGLGYYCKNLGSKYTEIAALLSFLSLAFIVFYLLYLRTTTTTTTGKEIEGSNGFVKSIQDFAGYVQSNLNSNCGQYRICQLAKLSKVANFDTSSIGFLSEAWTNGLDDTSNCSQLYPKCAIGFLH